MSAVLVSMQWEKAERTYCMCCQAQGLSRDYCMHTCLTYDERFHWLENDDYSKWPGRWFLLPISVLCPLSLSLSPSVGAPLVFPLMAQLLALMHFKHTAAATFGTKAHVLPLSFHPFLSLPHSSFLSRLLTRLIKQVDVQNEALALLQLYSMSRRSSAVWD